MKRVKVIAAVSALIGGLFLAASSYGGALGLVPFGHNPNRCAVTKSLFVNITTGRIQRMTVALLVSQANIQAIGAEVNLFLADEAAILAVNPSYWPDMDDETREALLCVQQGVGNCPAVPNLQGLLDQGAQAFGCPLCVQEVLNKFNESNGSDISIFNPDGTVNDGVWAQVIYDDIPYITPGDFELIYDRYTKRPLCHIDASVMSF